MSELAYFLEEALKFREERDWAQFHKPKDMALSLMLEAAELAEHFQWKNDEEAAAHIRDEKGELADELSDILYWTVVMSNDFGIDLMEAFKTKMAKNAAKYPIEKAKGRHTKYNRL